MSNQGEMLRVDQKQNKNKQKQESANPETMPETTRPVKKKKNHEKESVAEPPDSAPNTSKLVLGPPDWSSFFFVTPGYHLRSYQINEVFKKGHHENNIFRETGQPPKIHYGTTNTDQSRWLGTRLAHLAAPAWHLI